MKIKLIVLAAATSLAAVAVAAQNSKDESRSLAERLERIEQALARLEAKGSRRGSGTAMEGCRDMMGGGMMGGAPNSRWRPNDGAR